MIDRHNKGMNAKLLNIIYFSFIDTSLGVFAKEFYEVYWISKWSCGKFSFRLHFGWLAGLCIFSRE